MKNKGFTLVELVVAITISALLAVSIVSLVALTFNQYRTTRIEAQVQIEGQTISEYIKAVMQGCQAYYFAKDEENGEAYLAVNTREHSEPYIYEDKADGSRVPTGEHARVGWYYFYFDLNTRQCYVTYKDNKLDDDALISSIFTSVDEEGNSTIKSDTYLGQYVEDINIVPKKYSYDNKSKIEEYNYNVKLQMYLHNIDYEQQIDTHIKMRSR